MHMDDTELSSYILKHLSDADDPNDIISSICEKSGLSWSEAEALVRDIQEQHSDDITLRQAPLLTAIALVTFIGGLALLAYGLYPLITFVKILIQQGKMDSLLRSQEFYFIVDLMARTGFGPFAAIFIGTAMVVGSQIGMRDVWASLLARLQELVKKE